MRYVVMAVRARERYVRYLESKIPQLEVVWDTTRNGCDTYMACRALVGDDACIQFEDDIWLTKNFIAKADAVIAEHPDSVIQLFSLRKSDAELGSRWSTDFSSTLCTYLPAGYSRLIYDYGVNWMATDPEFARKYHDYLPRTFLESRKEQHWIHTPSLVQHREAVSMINPTRSSRRRSVTFEDVDP